MAADVRQIRVQRPDIPVGITQDGAPEMWNLTRTALKSAGIKPSHEAVHSYHFNERKAAILRIVEEDTPYHRRMARAAIYARRSTDEHQAASLDVQVEEAQRYVGSRAGPSNPTTSSSKTQ